MLILCPAEDSLEILSLIFPENNNEKNTIDRGI